MPPGFITRIIMRFGPFAGRYVYHYVYHFHILEHKEYNRMRPFEVIGLAVHASPIIWRMIK